VIGNRGDHRLQVPTMVQAVYTDNSRTTTQGGWNMFLIRFKTIDYRPDLQVTLRTNLDAWAEDIPGEYENDAWNFRLPTDHYGGGFEFKFVLEEQYWMYGGNLQLVPQDGQTYEYDDTQITFPLITEVLRENTRVQQLFFAPNLDENKQYDVIVIGSGIGGGVLADQLSDYGLDVLVLEAGSYLFPTHVGNLPRQHLLQAQVDKNIWHLWDEFKVTNYVNAPNSQYGGGQGFNLGGRSLFWGAFMPRMTWWELDSWPTQLRWDLENFAYDLAEQLLSKATLDSGYQNQVLSGLAGVFPDYVVRTAPMAIRHTNAQLRTVPAGVFSTADLLMESRLTGGHAGADNLTVNLNHAVVEIKTVGNQATEVTAYDLISDKARSYKGRYVVLAAGTVESCKLAKLSNLNDANGKIGLGITDHPIFYTHFAIGPSSGYFDLNAAAKVMLRHQHAGFLPGGGSGMAPFEDLHRYNIIVELGADFNQGRFIDPDILTAHRNAKGNTMLCEIVFLFNAALSDNHSVVQNGPSFAKPIVNMGEIPISVAEWNEIVDLKQQMFNELGAIPIAGGNLDFARGGIGGVAHEVGTLRMGTDPNSQYLDGVVDPDLKVNGYTNLFACDLSVFPSSPAANPTLTLAALALRLARHIQTVA
jgi:choline dehydrogenase-like flavoprotein